jgi:tetratricopeptide (TPR) repeat protein
MMNQMTLQNAYELMRESVGSGEHERAAGIARHILESYPQNLKAKLYLGEALIAANSLSEARTLFEVVCASDPENIVAQVGLSTVAEREGDLASATKYLERAMEIRPDMSELRPRLLNLYQRTARHDVYLHLSRSGLARLFMRSHEYTQAIPEFHQMALAHPDHREHVVASGRKRCGVMVMKQKHMKFVKKF